MNASVSRRSLLAGLGATALSAALPSARLAAASPGFIDVHHHHVPPALAAAAAAYAARTGTPVAGPIKDWTPEKSLASMDTNGVATSVLVLANSTGVWELNDPASLRRMARACNEYGAEMVRRYPGRYAFFAWLPVPDIAGCLEEITYALDHLGASGIGFYTSYGTRWAGDKAFTPIYDELDRRKAVAYYHPLAPACCNDLIPGVSRQLHGVSARHGARRDELALQRPTCDPPQHQMDFLARRRTRAGVCGTHSSTGDAEGS